MVVVHRVLGDEESEGVLEMDGDGECRELAAGVPPKRWRTTKRARQQCHAPRPCGGVYRSPALHAAGAHHTIVCVIGVHVCAAAARGDGGMNGGD